MTEDEQTAILEQHIGLVHAVAHRYQDKGLEYDDLMQIGSIALLQAAETYEPSKGKISCWLYRKIRWAVLQALASSPIVRHTSQYGKISLDVKASNEPDDYDFPYRMSLLEYVVDDSKTVADNIDSTALQSRLAELLKELSDDELQILTLRYGLDGGKPLKYVKAARAMGMSCSTYKYRLGKILERLKSEFC